MVIQRIITASRTIKKLIIKRACSPRILKITPNPVQKTINPKIFEGLGKARKEITQNVNLVCMGENSFHQVLLCSVSDNNELA